MRTILSARTNFAANSIGLGAPPIDQAADFSALFGASGSALSVRGKGVTNAATVGTGVAVSGDAAHALFGNITTATAYDTGVDLGGAGFTLLGVLQPQTNEGGNLIAAWLANSTDASYVYGFVPFSGTPKVQYPINGAGASLGAHTPSPNFTRNAWQFFAMDVSPSADVTVYRGINGALATVYSANATTVTDCKTINPNNSTVIVGGAGYDGHAWSIAVAQVGIYVGAKRLTSGGIAAQYAKLANWFNGKLSSPI